MGVMSIMSKGAMFRQFDDLYLERLDDGDPVSGGGCVGISPYRKDGKTIRQLTFEQDNDWCQ